jgi:hypothetical protein
MAYDFINDPVKTLNKWYDKNKYVSKKEPVVEQKKTQTNYFTGPIGEWIDTKTGLGYSGLRRNAFDQPQKKAGSSSIGFVKEDAGSQNQETGGSDAGGGSGTSETRTDSTAIDQQTLDALHFLGYTDDKIQAMTPGNRANWAMTGTYLKKQYDLGVQQTAINAQTFNDAYAKALNDPLIAQKYADLATTTSKDFVNNLAQTALYADVTGKTQAVTMTQEQKNLQEQEAAAGRAYSGFRQQAQNNLNTTQQGIITSTKSKIEQSLRDAATAAEKLYGSGYSGLQNAQANYVNPLTGQTEVIKPELYGNITGSVEQSKEADVLARQKEIYNTLKSPTATTV